MQVSNNKPPTQGEKQPTAPAVPTKLNFWLRLTSTGWDQPQNTIEQREKVRRSRLTSWILLAEIIALIAFVPATLSDRASGFAVLFATITLVIEIILNRKGLVTLAGTILVVMTCLAVVGVIIGSTDGQIHLVYLPAYDLLVIAVILGASILPRSAAFVIAFANIVLIYGDLLLQPWSPDLHQAINQYGMAVIAGRPVAIQLVAAIISFLWVRGMDQAIRRADRAEELRSLEQRFLEVEAERTVLIEEFVRSIITSIEALANGQEGAVQLPPQHPLQPQATFINTQLKQFYKLKQSNSVTNEQINYAARMLLTMLQRINTNQSTVSGLDPRQFSTQVPIIDEIAIYLFFFLQGKHMPRPSSEVQRPPWRS
ncbi:hypothetical protein [Dictyobacter arantiisoli]|uniref:HAMP domain-containing protein n=1 Tax=Dictyobacter arantiisoli TaxID=2014874 RepID=A0A5A5TFW5_9CHLR|nr:hypothetical protein [Dictyobacter arantiisoli]GCF09804.1 hypothetical protein KDI_33680 [Dictyobacter arantiisoli]